MVFLLDHGSHGWTCIWENNSWLLKEQTITKNAILRLLHQKRDVKYKESSVVRRVHAKKKIGHFSLLWICKLFMCFRNYAKRKFKLSLNVLSLTLTVFLND